MSGSTTFGSTISGGIQDISALLPLLGTEQCERHIGSALDRGFLYSAVAPISIFGSLGIVRASFNILIASVNVKRFQFLGAKALSDSGFSLSGTAARMIGMDGKRFLVETRLEEMLEEEHIDDVGNLTVSLGKDIVRWNIKLVLSTLFISLAGLAPYVIVILNLGDADAKDFFPLGFGFPFLRVFGSAFCVIVTQFLIQIRVLILLKTRLLFLCINRQAKEQGIDDLASVITTSCPTAMQNNAKADIEANPAGSETRDVREEAINVAATDIWTSSLAAEKCVWALRSWLATDPQRHEHYQKVADIYASQYEKHLGPMSTWTRLLIILLCLILAASCISTVVGYIGCFFLIQHSASSTGTLVWLGLEATFSVLRIIIWAANPSWDGSKGIVFELQLSECPSMMTTSNNMADILNNHADMRMIRQETFLNNIRPYTGPLHYFKSQDVDLHYGVAFSYPFDTDHEVDRQGSVSRHLLISLFARKEKICRLLFKRSIGEPFEIYSLTPDLFTTHCMLAGDLEINVTVGGRTVSNTHFLTSDPVFMARFTKHYDELMFKLWMQKAFFRRTWTMHQSLTDNTLQQARMMREVPRHSLTEIENALIRDRIMVARAHKLSRVLDDWVAKHAGLYIPASLPIHTAADSVDADLLVLYLEHWDTYEKDFLRLECRRFFEVFLYSYIISWDNHITTQRRKYPAIADFNWQPHMTTTWPVRFIFQPETGILLLKNMLDRITAHQPVESAVNQIDLRLEQFKEALTELIRFVEVPLRYTVTNDEQSDFMAKSTLPIRADDFRSAIKSRFNPPASSQSLSPKFAIADLLTMCERRADGLFSVLMSVDAALRGRGLDSISLNQAELEAGLREVAEIWEDEVQPKAERFVVGAAES